MFQSRHIKCRGRALSFVKPVHLLTTQYIGNSSRLPPSAYDYSMGKNEIELEDGRDRSITVQVRDIDTAAMVAGEGAAEDLDPKVAEKLRRKIDRHLLPLMCCTFVLCRPRPECDSDIQSVTFVLVPLRLLAGIKRSVTSMF